MSARPTVLVPPTTDQTPTNPAMTSVQRAVAAPTDRSRRDEQLVHRARREQAAEQARQQQLAARDQLLLTAGLLHLR